MLFLEARIDGRPYRWPLGRRKLLVGRSAECDVVVAERSISNRHLSLVIRGRCVEIEDQASRNGLWLDSNRVERLSARPGAWFVAGRVLMTIREGISLASLPEPAEKPSPPDPHATATEPASRAGGPPDPPPFATSGASDLARAMEESADRDELLHRLLGVIAATGGARGAALLARAGNGWTVLACWGEPLPNEPALDLPLDATLRIAAHPWSGAPPGCEELRLGSGLLRWATLAPPDAVPASPTREPNASGPEFVTVSARCRALLAEIDRLAPTSLPLLLIGETGTGKELLARRVHARSPRAGGPLVTLNCAAMPAELVESELFGIEKGVATGVAPRAGQFVLASGGTLFLDEVGDLPDAVQGKLLRALESGFVTPVGAPAPLPVDARIVAATHRDLQRQAGAGRVRSDLYYRLAGAVVRVPALRERPEDVLPLARHFAVEAAAAQGRAILGLDLDAARTLAGYDWPGNVRELRHAIARAVALADGPLLHSALLPPEIGGRAEDVQGEAILGLREDWRTARDHFDRLYFSRLLERCGGSLTVAARTAGLARSNLYRKLEELGLR